jgi:hypothetical protein
MGIVYSQGDYLVTTQGDSIVGIKILSYPAKGIINVNGYNTKLNIKYEDFHIAYKSSAGSEESKNYSDIKAFSSEGNRIVTWHARPVPYMEGRIEFNEIINAEGKTKDQLYGLARSYLIAKLSLTAEAIDKFLVENKENGMIVVNNVRDFVNTITPYDSPPFTNWIMYDITIRVKDNRSKITLSNFRCHYETGKIFDNKFVEAHDIKAEDMVNTWRDRNGSINSHLYQGMLMMFYCAEDLTIKEFEKSLTTSEEEW